MSVGLFGGCAGRRGDLKLGLQHFRHYAVAKPLLRLRKKSFVDATHRMARLRVKQKIFFFHAERVHSRNNRPEGTLFPFVSTRKKAAAEKDAAANWQKYGRLTPVSRSPCRSARY